MSYVTYACIAFLSFVPSQNVVPSSGPHVQVSDAKYPVRIGSWSQSDRVLRRDWKTFGNVPARTSYYQGVVGEGDVLQLWDAPDMGFFPHAVIEDGTVYSVQSEWGWYGELLAFDENTGQKLWTFPFGVSNDLNPPSVDNGQVYVQRSNGFLDSQVWSISGETGLANWSTPYITQWQTYMAPLVADKHVYTGGGLYGGLLGFRRQDGQALFHVDVEGSRRDWTPSLYAGRLYSWADGWLRQQDAKTGELIWALDVSSNAVDHRRHKTCALANSRAFVTGKLGLYAIDLSNGSLSWEALGSYGGTPAVANGVVYALTDNGICAFDAWNGELLAAFSEPSFHQASPRLYQPIVTDDMVIVSTQANTYILDRKTLQIRKKLDVHGRLSMANGKLYVAAREHLYAFQLPGAEYDKGNLIAEFGPWENRSDQGLMEVGSQVTITNNGAADVSNYGLQIWLSSDTRLDPSDTLKRELVHMPPLAVGQSISGLVRVALAPEMEGKYLLLVLDSEGVIEETNEVNLFVTGAIPGQ